MKSFLRALGAASVAVGSVIGAGFTTGNEIYSFFSGAHPLAALIITFAAFSGTFYVFLRANGAFGATNSEKLFKSLFKKAWRAADVLILFCYFLVLSTMLAAANMSLCTALDINPAIPIFSSVMAIICALVLKFGFTGIKIANYIVVPALIIFILCACFLPSGEAGVSAHIYKGAFLSGINYAALNGLLACCVLLEAGSKLTKKECALAAILGGALISALIAVIINKLRTSPFASNPMPLISIARAQPGGGALYVFGVIALQFAALTSIACNAYPISARLQPIFKSNFLSVAAVLFAAVLFSLVGFEMIINLTRPLYCALGVILILAVYYKLSCGSGDMRRNFLPPRRAPVPAALKLK